METHAAQHEQSHPQPLEYIKIAVILGVITAVEVAVYYIQAFAAFLVPVLLSLSALKFSLVVLWFMHLKFDNRLFSVLFVGGLMLAGVVMLALLFLFFFAGNLAGQHSVAPAAH